MPGELLTSWTIRLALLCYVAYVGSWLLVGPNASDRFRALGWLWTAGCGLFIAHVVCAFAFYHHWSHAAAWQTTAEETDALLGVRFGDGIYFSYVFLLVWVADVVRLWCWPAAGGPGKYALAAVIHAYLFFIAFNGAIVFEGGPTRIGGMVACTVLAALAARAIYNGFRQVRIPPTRSVRKGELRENDPLADASG
jgi:hypothetical protein